MDRTAVPPVPDCLFAGPAVSKYVDLPIPRYDALLLYCLALKLPFWLVRLEASREIALIFGFHLIELFKVPSSAHGRCW